MAFTYLKKALAQDRYISIASTRIGEPSFSDRDFGGLVFTETSTITVNGKSRAFDSNKMIEIYTADQALTYFAPDSDEVTLALQYFGYRSPSGYSPRRLCFARKMLNPDQSVIDQSTAGMNAEDKAAWIAQYKKDNSLEFPVDAIRRINGLTNNFGGFMFLQSNLYTVAQMKEVVEYNNSLDNKYEFGIAFPVEVEAEDDPEDPIDGTRLCGETNARDFVLMLAAGETLPVYAGTSVWLGHDTEIVGDNDEDSDVSESDDIKINPSIAAYMPLAVLGSVRYGRPNATTNYMFKQFPGQVYTVDDELEADAYDALCVNYIGLVQANGDRKAFSQQGYNINGEAINTYCNEMWLKSEVSTALLNLFLDAEIVGPDEGGQLLITNTIASVANRAKDTGVISIGKTLDDDQKTAIYRLTGDPDAWRTVQTAGYVLTVWMERVTEKGKTFYRAFYRLIYSKDDAILKVEGQHALV